MGKAVPQAAGCTTVRERNLAFVSKALGALRFAWGSIYVIGHDEEGYWGARRDAPGTGAHRAAEPEELGKLLAADFEAGLS